MQRKLAVEDGTGEKGFSCRLEQGKQRTVHLLNPLLQAMSGSDPVAQVRL